MVYSVRIFWVISKLVTMRNSPCEPTFRCGSFRCREACTHVCTVRGSSPERSVFSKSPISSPGPAPGGPRSWVGIPKSRCFSNLPITSPGPTPRGPRSWVGIPKSQCFSNLPISPQVWPPGIRGRGMESPFCRPFICHFLAICSPKPSPLFARSPKSIRVPPTNSECPQKF